MKLINNIFSSDLLFNLRREEESSNDNGEVGVSGRDYALVSGEMWLQALKWWVFNVYATILFHFVDGADLFGVYFANWTY